MPEALQPLGKRVHDWPGTLTKQNHTTTGLDKTRALDALCVGTLDQEYGDAIVRVPRSVLVAKATGRGSYARATPDRFGFLRLRRSRVKRRFGYVTGDLVRATVPSGKWEGTWTGRLTVRAMGRHSLSTSRGGFNVRHRHLRLLQRGDGYSYTLRKHISK